VCIFSARVSSIANTKIFARNTADGRQFLVYAMQYQANSELAMILPLPVPASGPENAIRFIDLLGYAEFFDDMAKGFILPQPAGRSIGRLLANKQTLTVHEVGSFEASFVPHLGDFARLDARFRLPEQTWEQLPQYADYGFAVFKLKAGAQKIHPMAFEFPRRNPGKLFYPTVHIHDGKVETQAHFDHTLYCQTAQRQAGWLFSSADLPMLHPSPAARFMDIDRAQGIIDPDGFVQMKNLFGMQANQDIVILD
jgi:hypothetical protein